MAAAQHFRERRMVALDGLGQGTFPCLAKFSFLVPMGDRHDVTRDKIQIGIRLVGNALLAIFIAHAANKFFVLDLAFELEHSFYGRILQFQGDAPDQYRIFPLLPLKYLCAWMPFNTAVLLYNMVFGMVALELLWRLSRGLAENLRWGLGFGLAISYIFLQYTGWRPDTMGLLVLCMVAALLLRDLRDASLRMLLYGVSIVLISFSRTDIALIYALFGTFYRKRSYALFIPIPIIVQIMLQEWIFPNAQYYSKVFMLRDNLSLYYLSRHPGTYLLAATILVFWKPIFAFVKGTFRKNVYFYLLVMGYGLLVLVIGRLNEYRLYLPFLPLLLLIAHGRKSNH
jgi:hypothetical protein